MKNSLPIKIQMSSSGMCGFRVGRNTVSIFSDCGGISAEAVCKSGRDGKVGSLVQVQLRVLNCRLCGISFVIL